MIFFKGILQNVLHRSKKRKKEKRNTNNNTEVWQEAETAKEEDAQKCEYHWSQLNWRMSPHCFYRMKTKFLLQLK